LKISVLILTLDEEANLPRCLAALAWCDDIVVLDSFSSDRTVEIARAGGARVIQRAFTDFADQRNFALETVAFRHNWVLHLDADEVVTHELRSEIEQIDEATAYDAYHVSGKLIFEDRWLRFSGMYPAYQVRLAPRDGFRFVQVGHGQREPNGLRLGVLRQSYDHYGFSKGIGDWIERHRRYADAEAALAIAAARPRLSRLFSRDRIERRRVAKSLSSRLPMRPLLRFLYVYVFRLGFLDRKAGYHYARLLAFYESMIDARVRELLKEAAARPAAGGGGGAGAVERASSR
jgi:glycosyltransferase involved in cell wall biosynthesis